MISLSEPVFFKSGRMSAVLSDVGISESRNDMLTISVIVGTNSAMHSFRNQVGNGSSSHNLAGESLIIFRISISVAYMKVVSGVPENARRRKRAESKGTLRATIHAVFG